MKCLVSKNTRKRKRVSACIPTGNVLSHPLLSDTLINCSAAVVFDNAGSEKDLCLPTVGDIASKVTSDNAVPGGTVLLVKLLLHERGNILLDSVFFEGADRTLDSFLLHFLSHICILDCGARVDHVG